MSDRLARSANIVILGGPAGSIPVLRQILTHLPAGLPAAVLVVIHQHRDSPAVLANIIGGGPMPVEYARDGEPIRAGCVYLAMPDRHLKIRDRHLRLERGPKENAHRPAVDATLRSAASTYGPAATGVIVSGSLDDGTLGLIRLRRAGGYAIVQDPAEAEYAEMPRNAIAFAGPNLILPAAGIAPAIVQHLCQQPHQPPSREPVMSEQLPTRRDTGTGAHHVPVPVELSEARPETVAEYRRKFGPPSTFTCPACGGAIWEIGDGGTAEYRCHTGHRYGQDGFAAALSEDAENALYAATRLLLDQARLYENIANRIAETHPGDSGIEKYSQRAMTAQRQAEVLHGLLLEHE